MTLPTNKKALNLVMSSDLVLTLLNFASRATLTRQEWLYFEEWDAKIRQGLEDEANKPEDTPPPPPPFDEPPIEPPGIPEGSIPSTNGHVQKAGARK